MSLRRSYSVYRKMLRNLSLSYCSLRTFSTRIMQKLSNDFETAYWQLESYSGINSMKLTSGSIPVVSNPEHLLIDVEAVSINPIDVLMAGGYGRTLFKIPRQYRVDLPLTLGRDFCGSIIYKGADVDENFQLGQHVYGFVPVHQQGTFAKTIVVDSKHVKLKPPTLTAVQCTSLVYTSMTAWSALSITANNSTYPVHNQKVLVLGASGGVGTAAVQILKSVNCHVCATCATDAMDMVSSLGADQVIDYKKSEFQENLRSLGAFDIVLDCAQTGPHNVNIPFKIYVGLNSPLLRNIDNQGFVPGLMNSVFTLLRDNTLCKGQSVRWGFFIPATIGFSFINKLITIGKIKPVIQKEYKFESLPEALDFVSKGHLRGKVVVNFK